MAGVAQKLRARQRPPVPARVDLTGLRHPTQTPANALAHRQLNNAPAIAARAHARGRLFDIGCGEKPYAPLFRDLVVAGKWTTLATFASYAVASYRVGPLRIPIDLFARTVQWVAVRLDELHFQPAFSWDHVVVPTKA